MGTGLGSETGTSGGRYSGQVWGDFELGEPLGRGPRGTVYRARQASLDRAVAVKVLDLALSDDSAFRRRFLREAVAVAQIASPHVVHIHFAGVRDGHPWFAMELVDGPDLRARLRDGLALSHAAAYDLLLQAARGLAAAAREGIVHRDLKPSNLLIDGEGTLKIADFGLVGLAGEASVAADDRPYASPERLAGAACDERSDIFSLGAIAYQLLARRAPVILADGSIESLRAHDRKLHPHLEEVVMRCLRARPEERWPSAQALVGALEDLLLAGKVLRRRRWGWVLAGAAAAAGLALATTWSWRATPVKRAAAPSTPPVAKIAPAPVPPPASPTPAPIASGTNAGSSPTPVHAAPAKESKPATGSPPVAATVAAASAPAIVEPAKPTPPAKAAPAPVVARVESAPIVETPRPAPAAEAPVPSAPKSEERSAPAPIPLPAPAPRADTVAKAPVVEKAPVAAAPTDEAAAAPESDADGVALTSGSDRIGRWADLRLFGVVQRFRWCPPGVFLMGSPDEERRRGRDEDIHQVTLTRGFWIADTECSQALWISVMGSSPSAVQDLSHPVERVSWDATHVFIARFNHLCPGLDARLPSESEWEYACRAGGSDTTVLESSGWFDRTSGGATHPIAQLAPNAWGLFDMRGNVAEWCEDGYGPYPKPVVIDPPPPPAGARVVRGGACRDDATTCRAAHRGRMRQQGVSDFVGFRLALGVGEKLPTLP